MKLDYYGVVQSQALSQPVGGKIKQYVPKSLPKDEGGIIYDLKNIADTTNLSTTLDLEKDSWEDLNSPPDRFLQFTEGSEGSKSKGFITGYAPNLGDYSNRKDLCNEVFYTNNTNKMYPNSASRDSNTHPTNILPIDTSFNFTAFRCPVNYEKNDLTNVSWYTVGTDNYIMIDSHEQYNGDVVIPFNFNGKTISVVEKTDSVTIHSNSVSEGKISISMSDTYGYAVLKVN